MSIKKIAYLTPLEDIGKYSCIEDAFNPMGSEPNPLTLNDIKTLIAEEVMGISLFFPKIVIVVNPFCYEHPTINCSVGMIGFDGENILAKKPYNSLIGNKLPVEASATLDSFISSYKSAGMPNPGNKMLELLYTTYKL